MIKLPSHHAPSVRQRGMTLIEILVAVVVLSVGLLGLAGLQLKGIQVNQGSVYRWQAAMLAEDIADRMRADRKNALTPINAYTLPTLGAAPSGAGSAGTQAALADWLGRVGALPNGQAKITAPDPQNQVQIEIDWADTRAQGGAGVSSQAAAYTGSGSYKVTVEL
jgi:type IV pilus assembly protein PilV